MVREESRKTNDRMITTRVGCTPRSPSVCPGCGAENSAIVSEGKEGRRIDIEK